MKDFQALEKKIKIKFKNINLLKQALVHRSYINEHPSFSLDHNERLEFLGDAVLELVVTDYLYREYSDPEGELTNWRASLVNSEMLSEIAQSLDFNEYLYLSRGESNDKNSKARQSIMADSLEAVIGAIYLDRGYQRAASFISRHLLVKLPHILENKLYRDPKSRFQEAAQEKLSITPNYRVLQEEGPDHAKVFKVGVYLEDEMIAAGGGSSKQEAQLEAAKKALKEKDW